MAFTRWQNTENRRNNGTLEITESSVSEDEALIESRRWIEEVTGKRFLCDDFRRSLADGLLLCELIETVGNISVGRRNRLSTAYAAIDNLNLFLGGCTFLGLTRDKLFDVTDLQEVPHRRGESIRNRAKDSYKRLRNVAKTIYWLAKAVENKEHFQGPYLDEKCFVTVVADAYKAARAKSPTFEYRADRSFVNKTEPILVNGHELNGESLRNEYNNQLDGAYSVGADSRTDKEKEKYKPNYRRRGSTGSNLKEKEKSWNMVQRRRYTEQFRPVPIAAKSETKVNEKRQMFQELTQRADEEASVLQGNISRHRRSSAGSVEGKMARTAPVPTRDIKLTEKRKQFEERDRQASVDSDVLSGKVRRARPKSYHGGDHAPLVSAGSKTSDVQMREKQKKYEMLQRQATLENDVLEGRIRQPVGAGISREDGKPRQQRLTRDVKLRDKQDKFEKLDRQAEYEKAVLHGDLKTATSLEDTVDSKKQTRAPVASETEVNLREKQAKFENLDRQASHENLALQKGKDIVDLNKTESAVLKGSVRVHPGMRTKDETDSKRPVSIPKGEDLQFREKHRKFEHLDWKAEQESSILNKNRRKSSGKEIREFKPLSTASRPTVNQFGQTKPIGYENVPDALITGSLTRRTPYRINEKRPQSNIYEYQPPLDENEESNNWVNGQQIHRNVSEPELNANNAMNAPHPPPRHSSLHRRSTSPRPISNENNMQGHKHSYITSEPAFQKISAQQNFAAPVEPTQKDEIDVSKLSYRDFVVPPSKSALEKREIVTSREARKREGAEEIRKVPRYVQQKHKVQDIAKQFSSQNQSPKYKQPPPRRALVDRDELERFERNTKAKSWYTLEDSKPLDYGQLGSYNTNRPRRHSEGPNSEKRSSPQEFVARSDYNVLSKSVPGDLHRGSSPEDEVFLAPESQQEFHAPPPEVNGNFPARPGAEAPSHSQIQPFDMPAHRRHEQPVSSAVYPTKYHAQPVFVEPSQTKRTLYPTELHVKPNFISPQETQRYPKSGPETDKAPNTTDSNWIETSEQWRTEVPSKYNELETEPRPSNNGLVHSAPDLRAHNSWDKQTKNEAKEETKAAVDPPADNQNRKIVVRSVARSAVRTGPQRVSVRAISNTATVYKADTGSEKFKDEGHMKPSAPVTDKTTYINEGSTKPVDSWVSYSDNSNTESQGVIYAAVKKTVQKATDIDNAFDHHGYDNARSISKHIENPNDSNTFVVGQIDVKRYNLEQTTEDIPKSYYIDGHNKIAGRNHVDEMSFTIDKEGTGFHKRSNIDHAEKIHPEESHNLVEEEPIFPSSHNPDRTLPGWNFDLDHLESDQLLVQHSDGPNATEIEQHDRDQHNAAHENFKKKFPELKHDYYGNSQLDKAPTESYNSSYHQHDNYEKKKYFSSQPIRTYEGNLSREMSYEEPQAYRFGNVTNYEPERHHERTNQKAGSESSDDSFASPIKYKKELVTPPYGEGYDYRDNPDKFRAEYLSSPEYREKLRKELKQKNEKQREETEYLMHQWRASQDYGDGLDVKQHQQQSVEENGNLEKNGADYQQLSEHSQAIIKTTESHDHAKKRHQDLLQSNGQIQNKYAQEEDRKIEVVPKYREDAPFQYGQLDRRERSAEHENAFENEKPLLTQSQQENKRNGQEVWEEDMYRLPNGRQVKPEKLVKLVEAEEKYWKKKMEKKKRSSSSETSENGHQELPATNGSTPYGTDTLEKKQRFAEINKLRDVPFDDPEKEERIRKLKAEEEFMAQEAERLMRAKVLSNEQANNVQISTSGAIKDGQYGFDAQVPLDYGYNDHNQESLPSTTNSTSLSGLNIYESFIHGKSNRVICCCCGRSIERAMSVYVVELDKYWHMKCFRCAVCNKTFSSPESQTATKITADILHCEHCFVSEDGGCTEV